MFDLDHAIKQWRQQMRAAGITTPELLNELEGHLRDDWNRQIQSSPVAQQAFVEAVSRIGTARQLEAEFAKTLELKELRERKLRIFSLVVATSCYLLPMLLSARHIWAQLNGPDHWFALGAVAVTVAALFSGFYLRPILPVISNKRIRTFVQFSCLAPVMAWVAVFALVLLPRQESQFSNLFVITLWAIAPLAIFGGVIFGLDEAARLGKPTTA